MSAEITRKTIWHANSVPPGHFLKFEDMNNEHLVNVLNLNFKRAVEGIYVYDIIQVLLEIAKERKLAPWFLSIYHPYDKNKPYLKYGEQEMEEKISIGKSVHIDAMHLVETLLVVDISDETREKAIRCHERLKMYKLMHEEKQEEIANSEHPETS